MSKDSEGWRQNDRRRSEERVRGGGKVWMEERESRENDGGGEGR